jgi:hypothetical protein
MRLVIFGAPNGGEKQADQGRSSIGEASVVETYVSETIE